MYVVQYLRPPGDSNSATRCSKNGEKNENYVAIKNSAKTFDSLAATATQTRRRAAHTCTPCVQQQDRTVQHGWRMENGRGNLLDRGNGLRIQQITKTQSTATLPRSSALWKMRRWDVKVECSK